MNPPTFSGEAIQELQALARQSQRLSIASDEWFIKHIKPLLEQCSTIEEWKCIRAAIPRVSEDEMLLDLPGNIEVNFAYAADEIRQTHLTQGT